jgi:phage shock protein A
MVRRADGFAAARANILASIARVQPPCVRKAALGAGSCLAHGLKQSGSHPPTAHRRESIMGFFTRVSDLVSANVNDLLDRAEDPEKMVKLLIAEMEEHLQVAHDGVVKAIAGEKRLQVTLDKNRAAAAEWQQKAEAALERGEEELARKCLARKKEHDGVVRSVEPQLETAHKASEVLKEDYRRLEQKVDEARRKRDALIARQAAAQAQKEVAGIAPAMSRAKASFAKFDRMESKVEQMEAEALALAEMNSRELEREVDDSFRKAELDQEFAALKEKLRTKQATR